MPVPPRPPLDLIGSEENYNSGEGQLFHEHNQIDLAAANQQLQEQQNADKLRILQLEHQLAVGKISIQNDILLCLLSSPNFLANGALVEDVNRNFSELLATQLYTLKQEILGQLSLDIRAEFAAMKEDLWKLDSIKTTLDATHEHCCNAVGLASELLGTANLTSERMDGFAKDVAAISLVRSAASSNLALLQEILKVNIIIRMICHYSQFLVQASFHVNLCSTCQNRCPYCYSTTIPIMWRM